MFRLFTVGYVLSKSEKYSVKNTIFSMNGGENNA